MPLKRRHADTPTRRNRAGHGMLGVHWRLMAGVASTLVITAVATAQQENPVYVDDSPQARELLRQARDQTRENAGEAVRLYQELLNEFPLRLVPTTETGGEQFSSTRQRVIAALAADQDLLNRYRLVQTPAAEQLLQNGELVKVALSYVLTEPGLEAMLRLAQRELEAGRFHSALGWLRQAQIHPDHFGRRAAHAHFMAALALHDLGDDVAARAQRDAMLAIDPEGRAFDAELGRLIGAATPAIDVGVHMLQRGPEPALTDVVPQAIWSTPLDDSLLRRRMRVVANPEDVPNDNPIDARMRDADVATASVTVVGPVAYINEGHTILALDRLTGREVWSYQDLSQLALAEPGSGLEAWDMSVVATEGDTLVTLTGHAQANRRSDRGRVICLDARDGTMRWTSPLSGIIDAAADEELFAHGAPVLMEGRVYVMARKVSSQLLTSAYVVALNAADGGILWSRYLAGSGGLRIAARPFDSLVVRDGALYAASAVGATARLDPATGEIRWLRRFNVPINTPISDQTRRPWEMTSPAITDHGLVTLQPDSRRVVMLDLETGDELANHSAASTGDWNSPRYLLTDGAHVFSVGSDIRCFNIDNLQEPVWRLPAPVVQQEAEEAPPVESIELRGRVQLAGDRLVAATAEGLLVIDAITGAVEQTLSVDASGNPLAYESQLLLASSDRLDAYMSLRRAEEMLRRQMAAAPDAPEPALSLLRLGIRAGNTGLALEAADRAIAATEAHADDPAFDERRFTGRAELFSLLLDLARTGRDLTPEQGESVFVRLQQAAIGPEQRVEHLLAYGDWLVAGSLPRAIETWQTILSDQRLASVWLISDDVARPAWVRAVDRIGKVVATRGASVYGPQSDFAALRLVQIRQAAGAAPAEPEALLSLAREFPFAPAAAEAAMQAAEIRMSRGDTRGALAALTHAYDGAPSRASASRLMGRYADIAQRAGWTQEAREGLEAVRAVWGDIELESASGSQRLRDRLTELGGGARSMPTLGAVNGEMVSWGAPIVRPALTFAGVLPTDRTLLRDGNTVKLMIASQPAWTATVEGASPQILRFDQEAIILWFGADPQNAHAVRLNPADGTVVWTTPPLAELFAGGAPVGDRQRVSREQMPNGDSFDPAETLALTHRQSLILVQRTGAIVALDVGDGTTVRWSAPAALENVHLALARDGTLALSGTSRDIDPADAPAGDGVRDRAQADAQQAPSPLSPRILVLDPETGRPAFGADGMIRPSGRGGVKWMNATPLGLLVYGTYEGIDAVDLASGERRWSNASPAAMDSQRAWGMAKRIIFEDQRSRLRSISLSDGRASDTFELPLRGEWDPMELRDLLVADETAIAHYRQRIVLFDAETGRVAGADAVVDERDFRWLVVADGRLLAISSTTTQPQVNPGGIRRTQYQYTGYPLSTTGKLLGSPIRIKELSERAQNVTAIDGWLLLSTLTDTYAVPMSGQP